MLVFAFISFTATVLGKQNSIEIVKSIDESVFVLDESDSIRMIKDRLKSTIQNTLSKDKQHEVLYNIEEYCKIQKQRVETLKILFVGRRKIHIVKCCKLLVISLEKNIDLINFYFNQINDYKAAVHASTDADKKAVLALSKLEINKEKCEDFVKNYENCFNHKQVLDPIRVNTSVGEYINFKKDFYLLRLTYIIAMKDFYLKLEEILCKKDKNVLKRIYRRCLG